MSTQTEIPDFVREAVLSLPPLPEAATRILHLARDPNVDFQEVVQIISADQTLTARVLRAANSALYGTSREVQTIRQAIVLLGREAVVQLVLSISVLNMRGDAEEGPLDRGAFWRHSMAVAVAARELAGRFGIDPERAFIAGLMHDIGKLVLFEHFGDRYAKLFAIAQRGARPLHHIERDVLHIDHAVVGQALCEHWKLSSPLAQAVTGHHDPDAEALGPLPAAVRSANALVKTLGLGESGNRYVMRANRPLAPSRDRDMVLQLPHEVAEMETTFRTASAEEDEEEIDNIPFEDRPVVYLRVSEVDVEDVFLVLLWALGYRPNALGTEEQIPASASPGAVAGCITDRPAQHHTNGSMMEVTVLNYADWVAGEGSIVSEGLDIKSIRAWLQRKLPPVPVAE